MLATLLTLSLVAQAVPAGHRAPRAPELTPPPNLVVIVADDFGVDLPAIYAEGPSPACTPNLDALARSGLLFRNAWANPVCSPSRAALLTGRYGFRTGIGDAIEGGDAGLPLSEVTLPELLAGYDSACVGKWHLSGTSGPLHPNLSGFARFAGFLRGAVDDYSQWQKVVDGQTSTSTTYATVDITDEAIAALGSLQAPWLLYVAYNAPHAPLHAPPAGLCSLPSCATTYCGNLPPVPTNRQLGRAMVEVLDAELGRLLTALDAVDPQAYVVFVGDNGTAPAVSEAPFLPGHAKGTLYEGGVNVPLLVRGPGVAVGESPALVSAVDLYATLAELGRAASAAVDSVSLVPCFTNPACAPRATVYAETFTPNGGSLPFSTHRRAVRDARYKLIRATGAPDELYDLWADPFEATNLLPSATAPQQAAYAALAAELAALGVG